MITHIWMHADSGSVVVEEDDGDSALYRVDGSGNHEDLVIFDGEAYEQVYPVQADVFGWSEALDAAMDHIVALALRAMATRITKSFDVYPPRKDVTTMILEEARRHEDAVEPRFQNSLRGWIDGKAETLGFGGDPM